MAKIELILADVYKAHSAKLLAVLTRIFGTHNFDLAEDVLQEAFGQALSHWQNRGIPDNPQAWLMKTAKNKAIDIIRSNKNKLTFSSDLNLLLESEWTLENTLEQEFTDQKIKDDLLKMIFVCCPIDLKPENRLPFILKTLCGFSIAAISRALLIPVATVKKRLQRTKAKLKFQPFEIPKGDNLLKAMDTVHTVLYLLFNEGFHSSDEKSSMKLAFCQEAIALVNLLIEQPELANQDTFGLSALMHFNIARIEAKVDEKGLSIPIDRQDRTLWQHQYINSAEGLIDFAKSVKQGASGRFLIEAKIAQQHCLAKDFDATDWQKIVNLYDTLIETTQSPIAELNKAVALGYLGQLDSAILLAESLASSSLLVNSYMRFAVLAHLNAKAGHHDLAYRLAEQSIEKGGTQHEHQLLMQQLNRLLA